MWELEDALGHFPKFVIPNIQECEFGQLPHTHWQLLQVVIPQIELLQVLQIAQFVGQLTYIFGTEVQLCLFGETGPVWHTCCFNDNSLQL